MNNSTEISRNETELLNSFNLELLAENIEYFSKYRGAAEWRGGPTEDGINQFPYPIYPEGMKLDDLINALGGYDTDYNLNMEKINQEKLLLTELSAEQIRTYLTFIVRGERFCDGHICGFMRNFALLKLCLRLDDLARAQMTAENPRSYSRSYISYIAEQTEQGVGAGARFAQQAQDKWILRTQLDNDGFWQFEIQYNDDGSFEKYKLCCVQDSLCCEFTDASELYRLAANQVTGSEYRLLDRMLSQYVVNNGTDALYKFMIQRLKEKDYRGFDYYRLGSGLIFKINKQEMKCYTLNPEEKMWKENVSLFSDFEWGSVTDYREIWLDEDYEIEVDNTPRKGPEIFIGRKSTNDLQIVDGYVSGNHALLYYDGSCWMMRDLGSTNGTSVNGEKISVSGLRDGDKIQVGQCEIDFCGQKLCYNTDGNAEEVFLYDRSALNYMLDKKKLSRYQGCLLGGAVGDALGYPIEFWDENKIYTELGAEGISTLEQAGCPAKVSDDTQMTLFAANALIRAESTADSVIASLRTAYIEWLATQGDSCGMSSDSQNRMWVYDDSRMHALRAPGNTCMSAIKSFANDGSIENADNDSKGCGTVMRAAPFGLFVSGNKQPQDDAIGYITRLARCDAMLTHGHPVAHASSVALARIIFDIVQGKQGGATTLEQIISAVKTDYDEVDALIEKALRLAGNNDVSESDAIRILGEGWVAEEALAIAVYCAVRHQNDFAQAIRTAVNHKGDSDSTGAICGNILGAWLGKEAVEGAFDVANLELADVVCEIATDLYRCVEKRIPTPSEDEKWDRKYRR